MNGVQLRAKLRLQASVAQVLETATVRSAGPLPTVVASELALCAPNIPPKPVLYLGRDLETQAIVSLITLKDKSAYIAILGAPGIGKTSVATAVLHAPDVVAAFGLHRFYVACDAVGGRGSSLNALCAHFGISEPNRGAAAKALCDILAEERCLLVLDNFESAWEAADNRADAEETLGLLVTVKSLSLVITMRGAERPQSVPWTRPLLPPHAPLHDDAAKQLFVAISDISEHNAHLAELLQLLDNVPLPLVLTANIAQYEPSEELTVTRKSLPM
ncbi:hypothetical protein EXIGLDRAFT_840711 [Exidia glandulosa HHB12029]|uniref:Novel STAND NTPase 1 domain-containing protein n=1 Tax=Exidia glandulosa HHB12029 TaxID=1314781 RepID=A0A165EB89_EXIGL|nr:hypothetical protein EXIGLDRAFT_840711 [Exidia glandulosa HHB12029]